MTSTARSARSRDGLAVAARRVLRERGLHGMRIRDVAAAAGMSPGAVMYHYPTTDDLLLAVHADTQRAYLQLRGEAARTAGADAWSRLLAAFRSGLPPYADGELIELLFEMHGLTRRSPRHAVLLTDLWNAELGLYTETIADGVEHGLFVTSDVKGVARALLALEDGLALHLVSDNEAMNSSVALATFASSAAALLGVPALAGRD